MSVKSNLVKGLFIFVAVTVFAAGAFGAKALTAQEKLEKGQQLYLDGKYDEAMDNFLDVFVEGNVEQINMANEYVNMIHFQRGGVSTPVRVTYDEELEAQKEAYKQEARDIQNEISQEYDNAKTAAQAQIDNTKEEVQTIVVQTKEEAQTLKAQEEEDLKQIQEQALALQEQERAKLLEETAKIDAGLQKNKEEFENAQIALGEQSYEYFPEEDLYESEEQTEDQNFDENIIQEEVPYDEEEKDRIIEEKINSLQQSLADKLNARNGVNVYFREGKIDAIDIDSDVIFLDDKITFSQEGKEVLQDVYALMLLSEEPVFVLLPPGSYTDEVNLQGVRQTVALNSYLINMGLSSAKLNFNMGLINEQPPAKFSNLEGISIVFDYDNKPVLYNKVSDKNSYPLLSLGMYPEKIDPALNEGMVIDFSVVETSSPIENWKLQIIQHASDGKYYIIRQVSGSNAIYKQIFWNGKKQFFGANLPAGKYTVILRAKDKAGREKVVRRKVEILGEVKKEQTVVKEAKQAKQTKSSKQAVLDYTTPRLWRKPAKTLKKPSAVSEDTYDFSETVYTQESNGNTKVEETTVTVQKQTTQTTQTTVVNPSATPNEEDDEEGLTYDPSLEDLL